MSYAFHTPDKLSFILDLMNGECAAWPPGGPRGWGLGRAAERHPAGLPPSGGDLHYHLSQHGVFSEADMRFYAAEIILGLEHMHNRFVVYRDLKVRLCPPLPSAPLARLAHSGGVLGQSRLAAPFFTGPPTQPFSGLQLQLGKGGEDPTRGLVPGHPQHSRVRTVT